MKTLLLAFLFVAPFVLANPASGQTELNELNRPFEILFKPQAVYTEVARARDVEGEVLLKVTLLSTGEVGEIQNVTKKNAKRLLKYGLVDQAIAAARKIRFTPKIVNGVPVNVIVKFAYGFSTY